MLLVDSDMESWNIFILFLHVIVYVNSILHMVSQLQGGAVVPYPP